MSDERELPTADLSLCTIEELWGELAKRVTAGVFAFEALDQDPGVPKGSWAANCHWIGSVTHVIGIIDYADSVLQETLHNVRHCED